jgi:Glycosyl transferase family 2
MSVTSPAGATVAIPTTGDRPGLRPAVEAAIRSAAQAGAGSEVLVVVNGRPDAPALGNLGSPLLRVIHLERSNVSAAQNAGIAQARHDTVLFTDDDGLVPVDWCASLRGGLGRPGRTIVAAPICTAVKGPVTAFLNYQRVFDAPPDGYGGVLFPITLSSGVRRDRLPATIRFDETIRRGGGQDDDFGHTAREAGLTIEWLADAPPVQHVLTEGSEAIRERYQRYGDGVARLHRKRNQAAALLPGYHAMYQAMTQRGYKWHRRFSELTEPAVRDTFTVFDYLLNAFMCLGYLARMGVETSRELVDVDQMGLSTGYELVELDADGLTASCERILGSVIARAGELPDSCWAEPDADFARLGQVPDSAPAQPEIDQLQAALQQHARPAAAPPPVAEPPAGQNGKTGGRGSAIAGDAAAIRDRAWTAWQRLSHDGERVTAGQVDRLFREAGTAFKAGCHEVEVKLGRQRRKQAGQPAR